MYDPWKQLTVGGLIPSLDTSNPDSMLSKAKKHAEDTYNDFSKKVNDLNTLTMAVNQLKLIAEQAKDAAINVADSISQTGFHCTVIKDVVGKVNFIQEIENSLLDPNAPQINPSTWVGCVMLYVTGTSLEEINDKITDLKKILQGL